MLRVIGKLKIGRRVAYDAFMGELKAVFSDSGALLVVVFATLIYTLIYSFAYGPEVVRDVGVCVVDEDCSPHSRMLISGISSGPDTFVRYEAQSMATAEDLLLRGDVDAIVVIPYGYGQAIRSGRRADVGLILDGSHLLLYKQVYKQVASNLVNIGGPIALTRTMVHTDSADMLHSILQPIRLGVEYLYNPALGYGTFVMPSILMVIIQQTLIIGVAMVATRRRSRVECRHFESEYLFMRLLARIAAYVILYIAILCIVFAILWPIFGLPFAGRLGDVAILLLLYLVAVVALAMSLSHLFARREAPMMLLLWCSVPILLLAGVSYPREAFDGWLYVVGRLFPSSSAVDAFVRLNTMGGDLSDVSTEIITLAVMAVIFIVVAHFVENHRLLRKKRPI